LSIKPETGINLLQILLLDQSMEQVHRSFERGDQELKRTGEYRRLHEHIRPAVGGAYPIRTSNLHQPYEMERTYRFLQEEPVITKITDEPKVAASWTMVEPFSTRDDPQDSRTTIESTKQTAQVASDWFSKLAKLLECQIHLRSGDADKAMKLAGELIDFDAPVDIELSIFYPLCIEVLIANKECDKALQIVDQLLVLLKDANSKYKTNMLVLRAWAYQSKDNGEEVVPSLKMDSLVERLTERELEILRLLNSHLPTPEIANLLAVSVNTVRTHIKSVYAKLGVHNRTTAIDVSRKLKLLA
jgi:DNA-binding CsgD family transcriptional regulator